jgi:hypothetical protein
MDVEIRGATHADIKDIKTLLSFYYLEANTDDEKKKASISITRAPFLILSNIPKC